eukprot:352710-Rhodomonas_salina.2
MSTRTQEEEARKRRSEERGGRAHEDGLQSPRALPATRARTLASPAPSASAPTGTSPRPCRASRRAARTETRGPLAALRTAALLTAHAQLSHIRARREDVATRAGDAQAGRQRHTLDREGTGEGTSGSVIWEVRGRNEGMGGMREGADTRGQLFHQRCEGPCRQG